MNCLEFRQHVLADPHATTPDCQRHAAECATCAGFLAEQRAFEQKLARAVMVDVPAHLRECIVLQQTVHRARGLRRLAYAAALAVVVGGTLGVLTWRESIAEAVVGHIVAEPDHLHAQSRVDAQTTHAVLHRVGLTLRGDLGEVRYAENCPIGRTRGAHLVLAGQRGPVTVLVLPDRPVPARKTLHAAGFDGMIIPAARGSVAIVGMPGEALPAFEQRLREAVPQLSEIAS